MRLEGIASSPPSFSFPYGGFLQKLQCIFSQVQLHMPIHASRILFQFYQPSRGGSYPRFWAASLHFVSFLFIARDVYMHSHASKASEVIRSLSMLGKRLIKSSTYVTQSTLAKIKFLKFKILMLSSVNWGSGTVKDSNMLKGMPNATSSSRGVLLKQREFALPQKNGQIRYLPSVELYVNVGISPVREFNSEAYP